MYILLCGYPPFNGENDDEILEKIMTAEFIFPEEEWDGISNDAKSIIKLMITKNAEKRPSALELLKHSWFSDDSSFKSKQNLKAIASRLSNF